MKKVMFLMAVAGMFAFAACNNATEEVPVEEVPVEEAVVEEAPIDDSTAVVEEIAPLAEEIATEVNAQ